MARLIGILVCDIWAAAEEALLEAREHVLCAACTRRTVDAARTNDPGARLGGRRPPTNENARQWATEPHRGSSVALGRED